MKNIFRFIAPIVFLLSPLISYTQLVDWSSETGLSAGSTLVDGQIIPDFAGTGLSVTLNVNVVGSSPFIDSVDPSKINIGSADGCSVTLTVTGGTLNILLENNVNLITGEIITLSNVDSKNITIQETASNGGARMTVDGIPMTGALPSSIVEDDTAVLTEQSDGAGTQWNASMNEITSFTWLYNFGPGPTGNEGFRLTILDVVLPVEFLNVDIELVQNQEIQINWQTASQTNNHYFIVQRSASGLVWEPIDSTYGELESSQLLSYQIIDPKPLLGTSYYRIKQVDNDGQFAYSKIVSSIISDFNYTQTSVYPNPTTGEVKIIAQENDLQSIRLFNLIGQDLTSSIVKTNYNSTKCTINLQALDKGFYYLNVGNETKLILLN